MSPQKNWEINEPEQLKKVLEKLESIQKKFNSNNGTKKISLADLIVLGGCTAIEKAASNSGRNIQVPFTAGRMDASQSQTDEKSMAVLEPIADGFRNYSNGKYIFSTEELLVDKAQLLNLTAPEMTVLVGGMRVLDANYNGLKHGVFTKNPETLSNDFFVNLLDMRTEWKAKGNSKEEFEGIDRKSGKLKWTATRADLIFGSNSELRSLAEVYASDDAKIKFIDDFVTAWDKVMNLDRFDI